MVRTHHILGAKQFYDTINMASPYFNSRIAQHVYDVPDAQFKPTVASPSLASWFKEGRWGDEVSHLEVLVQNMAAVDRALPQKTRVREFGDTSMGVDKNPPVLFDLLKRDRNVSTCSNREVSTP